MYGYALKALYQIDLLEDESKRPNVARWWKEITSRPAWVETRDEYVAYRNAITVAYKNVTTGNVVLSEEAK
jgi:hypothetical protein